MIKARRMTPLKQYAVVNLRRVYRGEDTTEKLFLIPGAVLDCHIKSYLENGYKLYSVMLCNKEQYLNAKVDHCVEDFLDTDREVKHLKSEFSAGKLSLNDYMEALEFTDEFKRVAAKQLYSLMQRLLKAGYDCNNEMAHELYNYYF